MSLLHRKFSRSLSDHLLINISPEECTMEKQVKASFENKSASTFRNTEVGFVTQQFSLKKSHVKKKQQKKKAFRKSSVEHRYNHSPFILVNSFGFSQCQTSTTEQVPITGAFQGCCRAQGLVAAHSPLQQLLAPPWAGRHLCWCNIKSLGEMSCMEGKLWKIME